MIFINTLKIYILFVPLVAILIILINYIITPMKNPFGFFADYNVDKTGPYECGFDSFRQSRTTYSIQFILIAILFLPFDLELTSILPYTLTIYQTNVYGLYILLLFLLALIIGFIMEINLKAIYITKIFKRSSFNNNNNDKYIGTQLYNK